jgi:nucleotide-binding universal stress UspA family protein
MGHGFTRLPGRFPLVNVQPMSDCMVLGYDRTDSARAAAKWAVERLLPDGKLVIVHSCRALHVPSSPLASPEERRRLGRDLVDELLLEGEDSLFDLDIDVEVSDEDPVSALSDAAACHGAEAIVVGSDRHSRLHRALGTVTTELLQRASVPVVVVPHTPERVTAPAQRRR